MYLSGGCSLAYFLCSPGFQFGPEGIDLGGIYTNKSHFRCSKATTIDMRLVSREGNGKLS
jgi:hypothetical protein